MKVLVCGSRDWPDYVAIRRRLEQLPKGTTIIHGGAPGADQDAGIIARSLGFDQHIFPAQWQTYGKRAGIFRNLQMLDQEPELVLAFQKNGSTGTQHTISEARRRRIPVEVRELWIRGGILLEEKVVMLPGKYWASGSTA